MGKTVSVKLAYHFGSIEAIAQSSLANLLEIDEVGEKIAKGRP